MKLFGEVLFSNGEDEDIPFSKLKRLLEMPYLKPRYRLSVLTQDEQVAYIIPEGDVLLEERNTYVFFAYKQNDGSLIVRGKNSSLIYNEELMHEISNAVNW